MLEFIPDRPALCHDKACTVDLLVRIIPPRRPEEERPRPGINLSLVVDRSGSMQGEKIALTRKAMAWAVQSLTQQDRLSIVSFANEVQTVVASTPVADKEAILQQISKIEAYGSTALFDGWKGGAAQACLGLDERQLNRVVLLTDGQANIGETNPDNICTEVNRLSQKGLQTTTLGFGKDYHEGLLRSMAASGGGNHFFVETADQIERFIELELDGLAATVGTRVRLRWECLVEELVVEPLGEVQSTADGAYQLADLTFDFPLELLFRITVPAGTTPAAGLNVELRYHSAAFGRTEVLQKALELPRMSAAERAALPLNPQVEAAVAVAMAARARSEAMAAMKRGDQGRATRLLKDALHTANLPDVEAAQLRQLQSTVEKGDQSSSSKLFEAQSYAYSRGSVVLGAIEEQLLQGWMENGLVPLRYSPRLRQGPSGSPQLARFEGMMAGLFQADPDGEAAVLALETLQLVNGANRFLPWIGSFFKRLADAPVTRPSDGLVRFRERVNAGESFMSSGAATPDGGALRRLAPLLLARRRHPSASHWVFLIMGAQLTHNDAASAASCLAFGNLLWELALAPAPPAGGFYLDRFLEVMSEVEKDDVYPSRAPRYDGWTGRLSEYLQLVIPEARRRGLSFDEARREWGEGGYLLECVPGLLYLLECHGHQPQVAVRQAQSEWLAPPVGAAMGALHGRQPDWELKGDARAAWEQFVAHQK